MRPYWFAFVAALTVSIPAHADRVAIEAYVSNRPSDAGRVMAALRPVLDRNRFISSPSDLMMSFAGHAWRSGGSKSAAQQMSLDIDAGVSLFRRPDWNRALLVLKGAVDRGRLNSIAWVSEPKYRDQMQRGLLYLSLTYAKLSAAEQDLAAASKGKEHESHLKRADDEANERDTVMAELIRTFAGFVVTSNQYGLEAEQLFERVKKEQDHAGRGSIEFAVDDSTAVAYVDETLKPQYTAVGDLVPGEHHVLVVSRYEAHEYSIEVFANHMSRLSVTWDLDSMLVLSKEWVGFKYPSTREILRESEFIAQLIGKDTNAIVATVLTVTHTNGHPAVIGATYGAANGNLVVTCQIELANYNDVPALERFVQCLTAGRPVAIPRAGHEPTIETAEISTTPTEIAHTATEPVQPPAPASAPSPATNAKEPSGVVDQSDRSHRWWYRPKTFVAGGAVLAATGVVVYALDRSAAADPDASQPSKIYPTHAVGIGIGAAGVAAMGVGIWMWTHDGRQSAPAVSIDSSHAILGWAGAF